MQVRAELNLILRAEAAAQAKEETSWFRRRRNSMRQKRKFTTAIDFEDLMITLMHWRLPSSVPTSLKAARRDRIEEVVLMHNAIVITDFFRLLVAQKRQRQTRMSMAQRITFRSWSAKEPHHTRRLREILALKETEKKKAMQRRQPWNFLKCAPVAVAHVLFHPLDDEPEKMVLHSQCIKSVRSFKPVHGIEAFRASMERMFVVMRFIDARNEKKGLVMATFQKEFFHGWQVKGTRTHVHTHALQAVSTCLRISHWVVVRRASACHFLGLIQVPIFVSKSYFL